MAFCPNCGAQNPQAARFCTSCGSPLAFGGPVPGPAPQKKSRLGLILGIVGGVVLIAAVLVVLFLTGVLGSSGGSALPTPVPLQLPSPTPGQQPPADEPPTPEPPTPDPTTPEPPTPEPPTPEPPTPEPPTPEPASSPASPFYGPAFIYATDEPFPFGPWRGCYVYNGNFFQTSFQLNQDYSCRRVIYKNGEITKDETGEFEYEDGEIRLYFNGDRNTWTAYDVTGEKMMNNNHEFFRKAPEGLVGAWVGDYIYNDKHIHTTYILREDGTYSEVTFRDEEKVTDNEGSWTFDGKTLSLKANDTPNITTPFEYMSDDTLINNNYVYVRS